MLTLTLEIGLELFDCSSANISNGHLKTWH